MSKKESRHGLACRLAVAAILAAAAAAAAAADSAAAPAQSGSAVSVSPPGDAVTASGGAPSPSALNEVVVTGSLLGSSAHLPTPITTITTNELLTTAPTSMASAVQTSLPELAGMRTTTTRPGDSHLDNASRVLDLLNLGRLRTLTLLDGRRLPATSTEGETDITWIPSMLVKRVDVVVGGASAVYGSDAVAGVVNFVLDHHYNGFKFDGHHGISDQGDGPETDLTAAAGTDLFGGRGHIEGSLEYYYSPGISSTLSRAWGQEVSNVQGNGTAANPFFYVLNTRESTTTYGGLINDDPGVNVGNPLRGLQFQQNGVLSPFVHGTPVVPGIESGGDGAFYDKTMAEALSGYVNGFSRLDYSVSDNLAAYAQVAFWGTHDYNTTKNNELVGVTLSATDAFLPPQYQQAMTNAGLSTFTFSRMFDNVPPNDSETHTRGYTATFGLNGTVSKYQWDVYFSPSWDRQDTRNNANFNNERLAASLDAVAGPNGEVVCDVTLTNPGLYPGCVPMNPFGPTAQSTAAIDYIMSRTTFIVQHTMYDGGAHLTGAPFATWAGPVNLALSAEYRYVSYSDVSDALPVTADCTGLTFNCDPTSTQVWSGAVIGNRTPVAQRVAEAALEGNVPLLKDVPFAQSVALDLAARRTHYDTSGSVWTWKIGLNWRVNDQVTVRATRSRDIRAPNLFDLFGPKNVRAASNLDLHTGLITNAPQIAGSNPDLAPEVAQEWTGGIVLRPHFLRGLSVALDVFSINIGNAITILQGFDPNTQQICEASNGASPLCQLIVRPHPFSDHSADNLATAFLQAPVNALQLSTEGLNVDATYIRSLFGGDLSLRGLLTYQPNEYVQVPGGPKINQAGAGYGYCCQFDSMSKTRANLFVNYTYRDVGVDVEERYYSGLRWDPNPVLVYAEPPIPPIFYTNLTLTYSGMKDTQWYVSVQNLFDNPPRAFGRVAEEPGFQGGFVPGDDVIGRYFTVGVRVNL